MQAAHNAGQASASLKRTFLGVPRIGVPHLGKLPYKGTLLGTPNREPQEYSRNIMEYKDPGKYIPIIIIIIIIPVESLYHMGTTLAHTFSAWQPWNNGVSISPQDSPQDYPGELGISKSEGPFFKMPNILGL